MRAKQEEFPTSCGKESFSFSPREEIKVVVAVMSGKGGVGKSTVTAMLAAALAKEGFKVGILDGDVTGASIPRLLGLKGGRVTPGARGMAPQVTSTGIKVISINLFLEKEDIPVIWRGPLLAGAIRQFWEEVDWGELDFLLVDLPPGTGDVPLTVLKQLPVKGVIVVLSPQGLAVMVVRKAIWMARALEKPVLGLVENMAYVSCPDCGKKFFPFGEPQGEELSKEFGVPLLATLPVEPAYSFLGDRGKLESLETDALCGAVAALKKLL